MLQKMLLIFTISNSFLNFLTFSTSLGFFLFTFFEKGDFYNIYKGIFYGADNLPNDTIFFELFLLPTYVSLLGAVISFLVNRDKAFTNQLYFKKYFSLFKRDYSINEFLNKVLARPVLNFSYKVTYKLIDRGFLELFGPMGLWKSILNLQAKFSLVHNSSFFNYLRLILRSYFIIFVIIIIITLKTIPFIL